MKRLKEQYKGVTLRISGRNIILDNVDPKDSEDLGLSNYFEGSESKPKKSKPTDKINGQIDNTNN
tara:strand:- start:288 stop:482 length:195 start_codon:yes stop_codon:yes gene_type:complete